MLMDYCSDSLKYLLKDFDCLKVNYLGKLIDSLMVTLMDFLKYLQKLRVNYSDWLKVIYLGLQMDFQKY